ncbi:TPA: PfkB family carbohydrate kinase, partial [Enterococcus faecium]
VKVISFGELLLRLAAPGYSKLFQRDSLETTFCGGEANVAVSLAIFGYQSEFITKLPDSDVGYAAANALRYFGVNVDNIIFGEGRMGLYYLEKGAAQRPSKVIYDRKFSAISLADSDEFKWKEILNDANWFHWTGINPALSENLFETSLDACQAAKKRGITISCDLNYRSKLWTSEEAKEKMEQILPLVDICICNEEDAEKVLGIKAEHTNINSGELNKDGYVQVAREIHKKFGCRYVATTLRRSYSASRNGWSAMLYEAEKDKAYFSTEYNIQIVDRVGGGDSFSAGIIYALCENMSGQKAIEFATASSCLKHTIEGDFNRTTIEDVYNLMNSGGNGRVLR